RTEQMDGMYPPEVFEQYARMRSIQRDAVPQDLVGTVLYLCSTASDFVTGQAFIVDGGHIFD
ncbi:MAG: SDR family oxidoreductase, partial [Chromatiales bacterium]|nr:SDR family oxidoreductase [Chromatiales bacterium]